MPHLIVEYSENLTQINPSACLAAANVALVASGHFEEVDIKSRAHCISTFRIGEKTNGRAFVAARLFILSGRSLQIKQDLSQRILQTLQEQIPSETGMATQISVEVVDIDRDCYAKVVIES